MTKGIVRIEVDFPVAVEIADARVQAIDRILGSICRDYEAAHPGRVMWPFGLGAKMLVNPLMLSDDEPIPFDDTVLHFEIAEREGERRKEAASNPVVAHHNTASGEIVREIVAGSLAAGGDYKSIMVLLESVTAGVLLAIFRLGGDNKALDLLFASVRNRLAELRLADIETTGNA